MFKSVSPAYSTPIGAAYAGDSRDLLKHLPDESVDLVLTSPPFALQRQKAYGNKDQADYLDWLMDFARLVHRSEEHTSELQSLMRISYAVFCLKKKKHINTNNNHKTK